MRAYLLLITLSLTLNTFGQDDPLPLGLPVKKDVKQEEVVNPVQEITREYLDSLDLKSIEVQTHQGYCDNAKAAIYNHKQYGPVIFSDQAAGCPLQFNLNHKVKALSLRFTGCKGKYKLVAYDENGKIICSSTTEIDLWEDKEISVSTATKSISYITFAHGNGCTTFVKAILF